MFRRAAVIHGNMITKRVFWLEHRYKFSFFNYISENDILCPEETSEPFFDLIHLTSTTAVIRKYHKYKLDINDEEYTFLKLMFDLKETVWKE